MWAVIIGVSCIILPGIFSFKKYTDVKGTLEERLF